MRKFFSNALPRLGTAIQIFLIGGRPATNATERIYLIIALLCIIVGIALTPKEDE